MYLTGRIRGTIIEKLQAALATLTDRGSARDYVQSNVAELTAMLANAAERAAFASYNKSRKRRTVVPRNVRWGGATIHFR